MIKTLVVKIWSLKICIKLELGHFVKFKSLINLCEQASIITVVYGWRLPIWGINYIDIFLGQAEHQEVKESQTRSRTEQCQDVYAVDKNKDNNYTKKR